MFSCKMVMFLLVATAATGKASEAIQGGRDLRTEDLLSGDRFATRAMHEAKQLVSRAVRRTDRQWQCKEIWDDSSTLFQFFKRPPSEESARMAQAGDIFDSAIELVQERLAGSHLRLKRRVNATDSLSPETLMALAKFSGCIANRNPPQCSTSCLASMYRTANAECSNTANPYWGSSNTPLVRWLPAQYENGFSTPIGWEKDRLYNGHKLPIVRKVSNDAMHTSNEEVTEDPLYSHLLVVWGQYIDHDIDLTPQSLSTSTFQGLTDCKKTCMNQSPCYPMQVPPDEPRIKDARCLPFFRSAAVCATGNTASLFQKIQSREQINAVTAYIDASTVYGSTEKMAHFLRNMSHDHGLMRTNEQFHDHGSEYLPFNPNNPCVQDRFDATGVNIPCFEAGDTRVSEHLTLSAIHTLWVREHNRIARRLKEINPHWKGEILYQETRKIVGAYHQVVNYKEYLPKILGEEGMRHMGDYGDYDPNVNPSVSNVFATAAFRFGHATIWPEFRRLNASFEDHPEFPSILLHQAFFAPWRIIRQGGLDPIMRGLIGRSAKLITQTQMMHEELREKLFAMQNQVALDLASLNLQRGRDHALPLYNDWRVLCNLTRAETFDDLAGEISNATVRERLRTLYGHPGNIDLWLAGLAEDILPGGSRLGPTFTCLLARQFKALRDGDRFYYRNPGVFSTEQASAIEGLSFARVICDNSGVDRVQTDVFRRVEYPRDFVNCDAITALDLNLWRESPEVGSCGRPKDIDYGSWKRCEGPKVAYYCGRGFKIFGEAEIECVGSSFNADPPICKDENECMVNNGGCEEACTNSVGSYTCACSEGKTLNEDGISCKMAPAADDITEHPGSHIEAIATGAVLGIALLVLLIASGVLLSKYITAKAMAKSASGYHDEKSADGKVYVNKAAEEM